MITISSALLNYPEGLRMLGIEIDPENVSEPIHLLIASTSRRVRCPHCGRYTARVHSRYERTLRDLPCSDRSVIAHIRVRRFRCTSRICTNRLFCERLGELAEPYARRTTRMDRALTRIGMAEGGRPGSRLAESLGLHAGRMTLLRLVRATPEVPVLPPRVLGVDDFALRRGHEYGTILYDIERHVVIDLLPDRSAESLAAWLRAHPGVEIISRDRADAYAQGARDGAPDAQQVADRWHLLSNLGDALDRFVKQNQAVLRQTDADNSEAPAVQSTIAPEPRQSDGPNSAQVQSRARRAVRLARYEEIRQLHAKGHSTRAIAAHLGISRTTVRTFLRSPQFPERAKRTARPGKLAPFHKYIRERLDIGPQSARLLHKELKAQGYTGSQRRIYDYIRLLRQQSGPRPSLEPGAGKLSPRQVVGTILTSDRTPEQQTFLDRLTSRSPLFAKMRDLAERFCGMLRKTPREDASVPLDQWIKDAVGSSIASLVSFATGLRSDWAAVVGGLSLVWSNGPVEGAINRLKMLKRQMYGRAKFDLLRRRVLPAI